MAARVIVFIGGVSAWVLAAAAVWLIIGPAFWVLYDLEQTGVPFHGGMDVLGIRVDQYWWVYFPAVGVTAIVFVVYGAKLMWAAFRPPPRT